MYDLQIQVLSPTDAEYKGTPEPVIDRDAVAEALALIGGVLWTLDSEEELWGDAEIRDEFHRNGRYMADFCDQVSEEVGVPVVDGVTAGVVFVDSLLRLGLRTSTRSEYASPIAKELRRPGFSL